ncbi:D-serine deaminase-like pyridoxal phosphate-dependent protein [Kutzneria kofuensis]|uniref:D-serine deaminase-like pyridoxal phosphate-dependent protein n=1 Tax=Kutzneria kofuensis TaxID=103725 RepID=A0A7W9KLR5_9PSEU|nr:D-serine deaminase-like pyridoxal phosphate-dependent protein [Kutzneria kofuensis]
MSSINADAVAALRSETIDWRFKGMPASAHGSTLGELVGADLFEGGFVGPLVVLDEPALEHNIRVMAQWCDSVGLALAPHGKTTMAPQLFQRQFEHGAWGLTTANISQLRVYRAFGVSRILMANQLVDPFALRWLADELDRDPSFEFTCWVDSVEGVARMTETLTRPVDVLLELGGPAGRTGVRSLEDAVEIAEAVRKSPVLRLVGAGGYEGALAHGTEDEELAKIDTYMSRLRELITRLAADGHFDGVEQVIATAGGSAYFDQVAEGLTKPWPDGLPVLGVLRSGSYLIHDDGLYRRMSPFSRKHRLPGGEPFRPAMHAWSQVTSHPEPGLALLTMGRRDVSYDQELPEPQQVRHLDGSTEDLHGASISALNDQHAYLRLGSQQVEVGEWVRCGLSHPCTVFDKWQLLPVVDGTRVVDLVRTFF